MTREARISALAEAIGREKHRLRSCPALPVGGFPFCLACRDGTMSTRLPRRLRRLFPSFHSAAVFQIGFSRAT